MSRKFESIEELLRDSKARLVIVAHDIRSAYNVGAMFRTSDGAGKTAVIVSGYSPSPENPKVAKTALGSDDSVAWYQASTLEEVLSTKGVHHVGLELTEKSIDLFLWAPPKNLVIFLYVGNEVTGLPLELMMKLEHFVQLPMNGIKNSLNVAEATSIAIYELLRKSR